MGTTSKAQDRFRTNRTSRLTGLPRMTAKRTRPVNRLPAAHVSAKPPGVTRRPAIGVRCRQPVTASLGRSRRAQCRPHRTSQGSLGRSDPIMSQQCECVCGLELRHQSTDVGTDG